MRCYTLPIYEAFGIIETDSGDNSGEALTSAEGERVTESLRQKDRERQYIFCISPELLVVTLIFLRGGNYGRSL